MDRPPTIRIGLFVSALGVGVLYLVGVWAPDHDRKLFEQYEKAQNAECAKAGGVWMHNSRPPYCQPIRKIKERS